MSLLGLDIGITGCKAVAFSPSGDMLAQAYREYKLYQPQPGWMELDPAEVWSAVSEVIGRTAAAVTGDPVRALLMDMNSLMVFPPAYNIPIRTNHRGVRVTVGFAPGHAAVFDNADEALTLRNGDQGGLFAADRNRLDDIFQHADGLR